MKKQLSLFLACSLLASVAGTTACGQTPEVDPTTGNNRVTYQIFVGSFSDSNGDGCGDLKGIINRMDYLNDGNIHSGKSLGVQTLWLSPIFSSPSYHKYDTDDYYKVDPQFGTEQDLKDLVDTAHARNVNVILDLAINHTSTSHPWFVAFKNSHSKGDTTDPYYDFYSYATAETKTPGCTYYELKNDPENGYYEGNFSSQMPELNYDNPAVRTAMLDVVKHYLDLGIDGFRFDAVRYIYYGEQSRNVEFWKWYQSELEAYKADVYTVGEDWAGDDEVIAYNEALNCFDFTMAQAEGKITSAVKQGGIQSYVNYVADFQAQITAKREGAAFCPFISNHDMDRSAGYLDMEDKQTYMAANLLILNSGTPYIYYGEEIGMLGSRGSANTDANRRLAMLWGDNDTIKDVRDATYPSSYQTNGTVKSQTKDKTSLLNHYASLIAFRRDNPAISNGIYSAANPKESGVGAFAITYQGKKYLLIHNIKQTDIDIDMTQYAGSYTIVGNVGQAMSKQNGTTLTVGNLSSVLLVKG